MITVAIVGRPNVGKSTLFNRMLGKRVAVVEDVPGVTRDRNYAVAEYEGRRFNLIDTGGFEPAAHEGILSQMREQTALAIEEADVVVFLMDVKDGINASDLEVAETLRKSDKPVIYCVNKVDGPKHEELVYEFYRLGADEIFRISALHGQGFGDLMDRLVSLMPAEETAKEEDETFANIAIIGRPNVGKSSLLNALTGEKRAVVHDAPGTTVDTVDTEVRFYGRKYNLVDTAGIRSRGKIAHGVEKYAVIRAMKAIGRCDVALVMIDAAEGLTEQDKKIAGLAHEEGKGVVIVLNKWDLVGKETNTLDEYIRKVRTGMKFLDYAPVISVSAMTNQRIGGIYELVDRVVEQGRVRVPTPKLNNVLESAVKGHPPGIFRGRLMKFYYVTQAAVSPPTFVVFVNHPEGVHFSYLRYLENRFRESFGFEGNPVRIFIKKRRRGKDDQAA